MCALRATLNASEFNTYYLRKVKKGKSKNLNFQYFEEQICI